MDKKETNRCPHCGETHPDFKVNTIHEVRTYDGELVGTVEVHNEAYCPVRKKVFQRQGERCVLAIATLCRKLSAEERHAVYCRGCTEQVFPMFTTR